MKMEKKKARVGLIGNRIVVRVIETQKELGSKKMTSPTLIKEWMREIEKKKNCEIVNVIWNNTTGKHWIEL